MTNDPKHNLNTQPLRDPATESTGDTTQPVEDHTANEGTQRLTTLPPDQAEHYQTHVLNSNRGLKRMLAVTPPKGIDPVQPPRRITLTIREMQETLLMTHGRTVIIGRSDFRSGGFRPDVDLSAYGAKERGVSRVHARLHMKGKDIFLTDLHSTNGSFVLGERLKPETPHQLHNGDEFLLGALSVKITME